MATPSEQDEGLGGRNMTMERVLEELSVTFFFVSEFMRRVSKVQYTSSDNILFIYYSQSSNTSLCMYAPMS